MNPAFRPLTVENWKDIEKLFGEDSTCGSCWCMWWRQSSSEWQKRKGGERKEALRKHYVRLISNSSIATELVP